ncbi:MAG: hypothetical protein C4303_07295 [candidate division GAL15 bacterium]
MARSATANPSGRTSSHVDLVVCGSVAVNPVGARVGKGGGYSDLGPGGVESARSLNGPGPGIVPGGLSPGESPSRGEWIR